jgi:hypothetical protein
MIEEGKQRKGKELHMAHVFMTIGTIEGTPLRRGTPIDPEQYRRDVKMLEDRGMRPPTPFSELARQDQSQPLKPVSPINPNL